MKLKKLIFIFAAHIICITTIPHLIRSMERDKPVVTKEPKNFAQNRVWIKAGDKVYEILKSNALQLGILKDISATRAHNRDDKEVTQKNPIDITLYFADPLTAQYVVEYLQKNDQQRKSFLEQLDKKSLKNFIDVLVALKASPQLILLKSVREHFARDAKNLIGHINTITAIAFSPAGDYFASGSWGKEKNLLVWDKKGKLIKQLDGHPNSVTAIAYSPDGKHLVSGSQSAQNNLIVWDIKTDNKNVLDEHYSYITTIVYSSDGKTFVSGSHGIENNLILWDAKLRKPIKILKGHSSEVTSIVYSPDGKNFISGSNEKQNNLIMWEATTGNKTKIVDSSHCPWGIHVLAFNPTGTSFISGSQCERDNLKLWSNRGQLMQNIIGHQAPITMVVYGPDGNFVVSGSKGKNDNLMLWNNDGKLIKKLVGHQDAISNVVFSPDGNYIASGSLGEKNNLIIWNGKTGELIKIIPGYPHPITTLAFSPDSNYLVVGLYIPAGIGINKNNNLVLVNVQLEPQEFTFEQAAFYIVPIVLEKINIVNSRRTKLN